MTGKRPLIYGSWPSDITADMIIQGSTSRDYPCRIGDTIYWQESRPGEQGRSTIVAMTGDDGATRDLLPFPLSTQSKVHEYGGKSWLIDGPNLFYVDKGDQRVYRLDISSTDPERATPLTPGDKGLRFADFCIDRNYRRLIAVCELHDTELDEPANFLSAIPLDGSGCNMERLEILVSGDDFYASPRVSPDCKKLCWLSWNHPHMPWDSTELYQGAFNNDGSLSNVSLVAGGPSESIFQPAWSPDNQLYFVSDRSGWWNLYGAAAIGAHRSLYPVEAEFATPLWSLGMSTYDFISADKIAVLYTRSGYWELGVLDIQKRKMQQIETPCAEMHGLRCSEDGDVLFCGSTAASAGNIFCLPTGDYSLVQLTDSTPDIDPENISVPEPVSFPTGEGDVAHGFFYRPANASFQGEEGSRPPLIVMCHGGPTGANYGVLNYKVQYWTSRGFALLDINYRGSTGYGREYREQITGRWGIVDVEDATAGVHYLASKNLIDPEKVIIRGSSAGGYTVLAALTFTDTFSAGASLYGIGDLEALAKDTHKFESRYLDNLVGPYPESREQYRQRSPVNHPDKLSCPVIFLQGLEDKVVPPFQAQAMVKALDTKGIPVAYVTFEDEGHGFRNGKNMKTALESELYFYLAVLDITSQEVLPAIDIRNLG